MRAGSFLHRLRRRRGTLLLALATAAAVAAGAWLAARPRQPRNLLLVVIDTLRADHLGCYGYPRPTSPHLDQLARQGVLFERAISHAPWTKPAMASLLTSLGPTRHGVLRHTDVLPPRVGVTLAEALHRRGFDTFVVQTNPFLAQPAGFTRGFTRIDQPFFKRGAIVVDRLAAALRQRGPRRFFGYVHLMDVHLPYAPPERFRRALDRGEEGTAFPRDRIDAQPWAIRALVPTLTAADRRHVVDLYDGSVRAADEELQRIRQALRAARLWNDTIVVVVADHGEELFDHGSFEHGHTLYNELLQVPLIVRDPRGEAAGRRVRALVGLIDVYPTLLGLLGLAPEPTAEGRDLSALVRGAREPAPAPGAAVFSTGLLFDSSAVAYAKRSTWLAAAQTLSAKLLRREEPRPATSSFDLVRDRGEQHPLAGVLDGHLDRVLRRQLAVRPLADTAGPEFDAETIRMLRSLGYVK